VGKLHPSKKEPSPSDFPAPTSPEKQTFSANPKPAKFTDLVFVIHGIGQKLSQRYEGFSFTYATNSLRRLINTDLLNPLVRKGLRNDFSGIAVLPINWRSKFSLGDEDVIPTGQHLKRVLAE